MSTTGGGGSRERLSYLLFLISMVGLSAISFANGSPGTALIFLGIGSVMLLFVSLRQRRKGDH